MNGFPRLYIAYAILFCASMLQMAMAEDVRPAPVPMPAPTPETGSTTAATQATAVESNSPIPLIVASTNSWFTATNWAQRLDWIHDTANATTEQNIQYADNWFIDDPTNRVPFEPAKFRLGLQVEADYSAHTNKFGLKPLTDIESEVHMPNVEKRLRLTISTLDPKALPGQDANQGMDGFRVGLRRGMLKDIDTSFGVRLRWLPSVYTYLTWDPRYSLYTWGVYPEQKFGWESDEGVYETSSLMFSRWVNRWMIRPIASLKLSRERYKDDMDKLDQERQDAEAAGLPPPDGNYPKGWDWELTLISGYAHKLFDESVFGRLADCDDIAQGAGFRFSVLGGLHIVESYELTFVYRNHLYKDWLYYLIKPSVKWQDENDWATEYSLILGVDILLYGTKER